MRQINLGRALGLSILAALGLMAMFVAGAQAEEYLVNKKRPNALLVELLATQVGIGSLLVPAKKIEINCEVGVLDKTVKNHIIGNKTALVGVEFSKCHIFSYVPETGALKALLPCVVAPILSLTLALAALHEKKPLILFEPDSNELKGKFTEILLSGELCPLPAANPITGNTLASIDDNDTVSPDLLFNDANCALHKKMPGGASAGLFYGGSESCIDAKVTLEATGKEHLGATLGVS